MLILYCTLEYENLKKSYDKKGEFDLFERITFMEMRVKS